MPNIFKSSSGFDCTIYKDMRYQLFIMIEQTTFIITTFEDQLTIQYSFG